MADVATLLGRFLYEVMAAPCWELDFWRARMRRDRALSVEQFQMAQLSALTAHAESIAPFLPYRPAAQATDWASVKATFDAQAVRLPRREG